MNNLRNLALWILIALLLVALFNLFQGTGSHPANAPMTFSDFYRQVDQGTVKDVTIQNSQFTGHLSNGQAFVTYGPSDTALIEKMNAHHVNFSFKPEDNGISLVGILIQSLPMLHPHRRLDILHAPDAGWRRQGDGLRQIAREAAYRTHRPRDV